MSSELDSQSIVSRSLIFSVGVVWGSQCVDGIGRAGQLFQVTIVIVSVVADLIRGGRMSIPDNSR